MICCFYFTALEHRKLSFCPRMEQHQIDLETALQKVFQDAYLFCVAAPLSGIMFGVVLPLGSVLLLDFSYSSLNEVKYSCVNYYSYCKSVLK